MMRGAVVFLLVLLLATAAGIYVTREHPFTTSTKEAPPPVDLQPFRTAQDLARQATPEEQPLAQEALRLADHQTDLAFAAALNEAAAHPPPPDPRAAEILARLQSAQKQVEKDEERIAHLTAADELAIAKAQLEIDQDDIDDAKQDLERAGGAPQSRIARMIEEHEAAEHGNAPASAREALAPLTSRGVAGKVQDWYRLHQRLGRVVEAQREALAAAATLSARHDTQERNAAAERAKAPELAQRPSGVSSERAAAILSSARKITSAQKRMVVLDKRILDDRQLADVYGRWAAVVAAYQRLALHDVLVGASSILLTLVGVLSFSVWLDRYCEQLAVDRRRLLSLRHILRITVQCVGVSVILLLCLGPPAQLSTVLGLLGAAATVALKDFVIAFFGWFILMGKNGIRVGDWVEINGVGGEVVAIGLFRTVLLETGNWTDSGHPTGRRVTLVNSFAVTGHYFNFSTSGQWLWDELRFTIPAGQNPGPLVEAIRKQVSETTAEDARLAEQEWQRVEQTQGMTAFSAEPAVNLRPGPGGVDVVVRYITRVAQRQPMRAKLYTAVVEAMGSKNA